MKKVDIETFFSRLQAADPEPKGELNYGNNYTLLVAVVLSAQATDVGVNKATKALFEAVDNPAAMLALGEAKLKQHIRTIGLFNTKAKNVIALSRRLLDVYGGQVPESREELESLPGVGRKTANVVCNIASSKNAFNACLCCVTFESCLNLNISTINIYLALKNTRIWRVTNSYKDAMNINLFSFSIVSFKSKPSNAHIISQNLF